MLNKLVLASLVTFISSTSADTATPVPMPPKLPIAPLWQIDMRADVADLPTSTITVWTNGYWSIDQRDHGKVTLHADGHMAADAFTKLTRVLATATWKSTTQKFRCMAYSASFTVYSYQGREVLVSRTCDGLIWDQPTAEAVARATELTNVFALTGKKPVPPKS